MVSDAFNSLVLLTGYWPCPKELQRFPFFHQPIVPMVDNTNCWFCCLSILAHIYSRRTMILRRTLVRKECAKLFWMQPYPLFSKLTIFTFLVKKTVLQFPQGNFWWEWWLSWKRLPLMRTIFDWNVRKTMPCHFRGGSLTMLICLLGQKCPQTWPMRTMSDLTCIFPVRMCNHSLGPTTPS